MEENNLSTQILFCSLFLALVLLSRPALVGGGRYDFNYDPLSDKGPTHWGDFQADWYKCKNGTMQSPINLLNTDEIVSHYSELQRNYRPADAFLVNSGHDITLAWQSDAAGFIVINQTQYYVQQCVWHSPSEHTFNGRRYDLELQIVHKDKAKRYAVVAILYQIGRRDPFLASLMESLKAISGSDKQLAIHSVGLFKLSPEEIGINSSNYFRYNGSLTTPPCYEDVVWTVTRQIKTVSQEQVFRLRDAVGNASYTNARSLQPRNNRPVKLYIQK